MQLWEADFTDVLWNRWNFTKVYWKKPVPFVQFKNRGSHPRRSLTFSKVAGFSLQLCLKATLLHGCFSCFLNGTNDTKSPKTSHLVLSQISPFLSSFLFHSKIIMFCIISNCNRSSNNCRPQLDASVLILPMDMSLLSATFLSFFGAPFSHLNINISTSASALVMASISALQKFYSHFTFF